MIAGCFLAIPSSRAELALHRLFTDNAVLQRGVKVKIWGTADAAETVTVKFADQTVAATPQAGRWQVELAPLEANSNARDLVVTQSGRTLIRTNIVVGEVWLCGGQSNMNWPVQQADGARTAIPNSANPQLRLFTVDRRSLTEPTRDLTNGNWAAAVLAVVAEFSAVGYYFGRNLQRTLQVPVGLIDCSVNGCMAEQWIDPHVIAANPLIMDMSAPQGKGDLSNGMLVPLVPIAFKGVIWYQGEGNGHRPYIYRHVLATMVQHWRALFGQGDFPFFMVELAPFLAVNDPDLEWAVVRESQQWVAKNLTNVETVSTVDVGDRLNLHPQAKQPIGTRLAIAARAMVYGEKITPTGPRYDRVAFQGQEAIVTFRNVGQGLEAKKGDLTGFTLAAADKVFHPAQARIESNQVVVTAEAVALPQSVRFGWTNYPVVNLWNKDGLPAHPFRTDDWKVTQQDVK